MTLILDLDERVDSENLRLEIGRSYAYVGSTLVRTHAAAGEDAPAENTMRMLVKLGTRQYLAAGEEGSDELWNDVMRDWFRNQFRKLGNQALIYNKRQKEMEDGSELAFTWLEVDLQNGTLPVRLRMNDVSGIAEDAADMLSLVRDAYNEGKLGDAGSIARVSMPSADEWAAQVDAGAAAFAERKAAEEAAAAEADAKTITGADIQSVADFDAAIAKLEVNADSSAASTAMTDNRYTSVSSVIADWISDSSRKEGDKTYIASTSTSTDEDGNEVTTISGYYAVYYIGSTDNQFPLVNVRHILAGFEGGTTDDSGNTTYSDEEKAAAKQTAEDLLNEWKQGEATEDSFAALATEKTTDTGSKDNGGLYENVYPGQMVSAFNNWCFDSSRKPGDTGIVETNYGYHVMYFVGQSEETYREYLIKTDLETDAYNTWYNTLVESVDMTVGDTSHIRTGLVLSANS